MSINPLPSLIQAAAHDVAARRAREAGRTAWSRGDYNLACRAQDRLIRQCYARNGDSRTSKEPFVRFSIAIQMEQSGLFRLDSNFKNISRMIDDVMEAP